MKLRWKYFIGLLVTSLVPLAVVTLFSHNASNKLGRTISEKTQNALLETVRRDVVAATENYAIITRRAKSSLEFALQFLIREADAALDRAPPKPGKIYFARDFDNYQSAPEDLAPSSIHLKILKAGPLVAKMVSYRHPNFLVAPGVRMADVNKDILKFTRLSPVLKRIAAELGDGLFWIYASLETGGHISYPGHGGYPEDYDPRLRPWYIRAKRQGALTWGPPIVDTTTGQLTFTVSAPFFKSDGALAGVAAIDVLIPNVLLKNQISSQWSRSMQSFLVGQSNNPDNGENQLWVLSQKINPFTDGGVITDAETGTFIQEHKEKFNELIQHFKNQKSGSLEMPYQGEDSFWAFATIFPDLHFVIVAPKSMIMGLPKEVGESFADYTEGQTFISVTAVIVIIVIVSGIAIFVSRLHARKVIGIVNGFKRLEQGDFSVRLDLEFKDERDLIVATFNQIIPRLKEHLRMSRALGVAKDVQQSLLPRSNPMLQGFDIAGTSIYCEETGGDYYDFINIKDNRLAVVVGDVSGHGISSALLMATARALIMLRAAMPGSTAHIINDVNRHLSMDTHDTGNFMTFFYCGLAASDRVVRWVRAGHDPALLYDPKTDGFDELRGQGMAFGLDDTFAYEEFQRTLAPGQLILIGTDGIWEMRNEADEMFGKKRLKAIIRSNSSATAKEILASISVALESFRGGRQPDDDVTMVVIKVER